MQHLANIYVICFFFAKLLSGEIKTMPLNLKTSQTSVKNRLKQLIIINAIWGNGEESKGHIIDMRV